MGAQGFYSSDDLLNFALAREMGLTWDFLTRDIFGHWAPGHRMLDWVITQTTSLHWWPALTVSALFAVLALVFLDRLLRALTTPTRIRYMLLGAFSVSPLIVRPITWFAAGLHVLPGLAFVIICLDGFVRYRTTRRATALIECISGFSIGLLFYEIPLLLIGFLALLSIALSNSPLSLRVAVRELLKVWPVWASLVPIGLVYAWNYETNVAYSLPHPSVDTFLSFLGISWSQGLVPGLAGMVLPDRALGGQTFTIVVTQLLLLTLVGISISRNRRAWRGWVLFAAIFTANAGLVGWNRSAQFGANIGADLRYHTIIVPFFVLAIAMGFGERGTASRAPSPRRHVLSLRIGAVLLIACAMFAVRSDVWLADHAEGAAVKVYVENARADLARLRQRHEVVTLYDGVVPFGVVPKAYFPYNRASQVLPEIDSGVSFDGTSEPRYMVGDDGHIRRAEFSVHQVATIETSAGHNDACVTASDAPVAVPASLQPSLGSDHWIGRLHLEPGSAVNIRLIADDGQTSANVAPGNGTVHLPAQTREYFFTVAGIDIHHLNVEIEPQGTACVVGIDFGLPTPA